MNLCLRFLAVATLMTTLAAAGAFGQSAGSYAGNFTGMTIIPTVICDPSSTTTNACSGATGSASASGSSSFLSGTIKQSGAANKSLLISGSLQTSLLTQTTVQSSNGSKSTSVAFGSIVVTPTVTDSSGVQRQVYPPSVVFNARLQSLTANLLGLGCTANLTTGAITCTSPEVIGLLLSTTSANSFNFLAPNLGEGVYTVTLNIQAQAQVCPTSNNAGQLCTGSIQPGTSAQVGVGVGSLGVTVVQTQTPFSSLDYSL